jgi:hypothetical protein
MHTTRRMNSPAAGMLLTALLVSHALADLPDPLQGSRPLLEKYCFDCHNADGREADIDLTAARSQIDVLQQRRVWQRVREVLRSNRMPPEDAEQPSSEERKQLMDWIDRALTDVDWESVKWPGQSPLARLTNREYQYTVEDLFGVAVDLSDVLPTDPEGLSGFANDRTSLVMTDKQLERYFRAAERVADTVLDSAEATGPVIRYEVESGENASFRKQTTTRGDGSVGWKFSAALGEKYQSVRKTIDFPSSGFYRVRIRAGSTGPGPTAGMWIAADSVNDASREAGVLVTGPRMTVYETEMYLTAGRHEIMFGYDFYRPLWLPAVPTRPQMKLGQSTFDPPPYDRQSLLPDGVSWEELVERGFKPSPETEPRIKELIAIINEGYYREVLDRLMRNQFHYAKGYLPVFIGGLGYDYLNTVVPAFEELANLLRTERRELESLWKSHETPRFRELEKISAQQQAEWKAQDDSRKAAVGGLFVDWIEFEPRAARREALPIPDDEAAVESFLNDLLPRAFRRPVANATLASYRSLYDRERTAGASHRRALQRLLIGILVSPDFLYRFEGAPTAGVERLGDHALASRLSYFLWASMPDSELFELADRGRLQSEAELRRQVARMLDDRRLSRFARQFSEQWLNLSGLGEEKEPDRELFRYFSWHLASDMRSEVALMLERILREDRSLVELLDSHETYLNERLARLYDIDGVAGERLRLVPLTDPRRGGLLGTAAVLTSTSLATRTSPVRRGTFVLETLLGADLPPPPPGVPNLPADAGQNEKISLRATLAAHRDDPRCAGCHDRIDPLGFALENFDWVGRWRVTDPAGPVDTNGRLPDGTELDGIADLKAYLVEYRKDDFTRAVAESMLAYVLGRELEYFDQYAIQQILQAVRADGYRARTLVAEIASSYPFRFRGGGRNDEADQ